MLRKLLSLVFISLVLALTPCQAEELAELSDSFSLDRCLSIALERNFEIQKAKERILKQRGVSVEARARFLPRADISSLVQRADRSTLNSLNNQTFGDTRSWNVGITAKQTVFSGGRDLANFRRQLWREEEASHDLATVISATLLEVRERFYTVLLARARVKVQEQSLNLLEEELKNERQKLDVGKVSDFNVLRAEVAVANSRTPLIRARNDLKISLEQLSRTLGLLPSKDDSGYLGAQGSAGIIVEGELAYTPYFLELDEALAKAALQRSELQKFKSALEAQKQAIWSERAGYLPEISAFADYGAAKSQFTSDFRDENHGWTFGVRGDWNVFDGFATSARVTQAQSDRAVASLEYSQSKLNIAVEVRAAFYSLLDSKQLVESSQKVVSQAEESLRLAKERLKVGAGIQLDVLDSEVALTSARTNEIEALYDYNVAVVRLKRAIGEGEKFDTDAAPKND